ncbi:putative zinc-binding metallopeptidase [Bradyrhizobium sp. B117]|uniref:zinc-binding metallopeptidase family protein n=1 Tax=Bradyrhizobium sp. B117 TaxID=3140246 RepID=UPI0031831F3F
MRKHNCPNCNSAIFFEQEVCTHCTATLLFVSAELQFRSSYDAQPCANRTLIGCNWASEENGGYCPSCTLSRTIPPLETARNVLLWRRVEEAKRRLLYDLARLELPLSGKNGRDRVAFDVLADDVGQPVITGHLNGLITLNLSEADDPTRELRRTQFREPYRTLLGHFRHEVGHFYWEQLVGGTGLLNGFRVIFGDETADYAAAIANYHKRTQRDYDRHGFISEYATSHPWEDWAETFAHFLHIVSTLDSASSLPLSLDVRSRETLQDPYLEDDFESLLASWTPVAYTMNELNRSMGLSDAYPFDLSLAVRGKLHFVHMSILTFRRDR